MNLFHRADRGAPQAILEYLEIVTEDASRSDEEILETMVERGHGQDLSWQIIGLIPCFASREKLAGLGIRFSDEFVEYDLESQPVRSGKLKKHEVWSAAMGLRNRIRDCPALHHIVLRSAEFTAINEALNSGSEPQNLETSPIAIVVMTE